MRENGQEYSGRFVLRIATDLHEALTHLADTRQVSLNLYVQNLVASHVAGVETATYAFEQAFRLGRTGPAVQVKND